VHDLARNSLLACHSLPLSLGPKRTQWRMKRHVLILGSLFAFLATWALVFFGVVDLPIEGEAKPRVRAVVDAVRARGGR
jgi:hypothetical protein